MYSRTVLRYLVVASAIDAVLVAFVTRDPVRGIDLRASRIEASATSCVTSAKAAAP